MQPGKLRKHKHQCEMKLGFESLDSNSEKMEEIYKTDNFINDIAFGVSFFVFYDLNTYFQL